MIQKKKYFRPQWTCGRYNKEHEAAIYYNLIEGISYFFESYSAMVVGEIISTHRECEFNVADISQKLNISTESLLPFLEQLEQLGLISSISPTDNMVSEYRRKVSEYNRQQRKKIERDTQEKLPYAISNAESLYTEKVGGITSVMFELTYRCSEKCIHCYNIGAARNEEEINCRGDRKELTFNEYKQLIDDLYEEGLVKVCLTGGDPFSKSCVWEVIDYLYHKDVVFDVFTNGQCVISDVGKLANYYPRLVGVSIYSGIAEIHDYITRVKGSWERSIEVIRQLSSLAVPLHLKCCVMQPNVKSYFMVADIAREYGAVPQFEINLTDSIEGDRCVSKYLRMTPEQLEIVLRDDNIPLYVGKEAPNYGGQSRLLENNACGAGENSLCITPEGNVIPCCAFHTSFGNLREQSIYKILNECKELTYWRSLTLNDYEECGRYNYCAYCNLCPGNNYIEHGTPLKASEVNCFVAKIRHELAEKMMKGYDPLNGKTLRERLAELPDYEPIKLRREISFINYSDTKLKTNG